MKPYYLGADVGATKTHVLIGDREGQVVGFGESGPGNHQTVGYDGLQRSLATATDQALAAAGITVDMISGAGFGVAGYDWPSERDATLAAIQPLGIKSPLVVVNDAILGVIAGSSQGWGIAVVAGTGCNCRGWGKERAKEGRVVGRSSLVGEGAGATELVEKAMQAIAYEWTQRGVHTGLTPVMIQYAGAHDLADLLEGYCMGRYTLNASAAQLVFQVAAAGDVIAMDIIRWAGRELGELARAVIRQLGFEKLEFDVVLVGGLYDGSPLLIETMRQTIRAAAPAARLIRLSAPPVIGAVLLGMEAAGYGPSDAVRHALGHIRPEILK